MASTEETQTAITQRTAVTDLIMVSFMCCNPHFYISIVLPKALYIFITMTAQMIHRTNIMKLRFPEM